MKLLVLTVGEAIKGLEGGKGPIFKEGLSCEGDERFIATCHANSADSEFYTCTHQTDAGVRCLNGTYIIIVIDVTECVF